MLPAAGSDFVIVGHINVKDKLFLHGVELARLDFFVVFWLGGGGVRGVEKRKAKH